MLYAADRAWWEHHIERVRSTFRGECWTPNVEVARRYSLHHVPGSPKPGLGRDGVHYGENSGYQAVNLVYLLGATRIVLLGYDMKPTGGRRHWFGNHPGALHRRSDYPRWVEKFRGLALDLEAEGVEVVNCSRETALDCFPRAELEVAL